MRASLSTLIAGAAGLCLAAVPTAWAKPTAPPWLSEVIARPASMAYGKAKAVVLLDESVITVDDSGTFTTRTRWAVRLLTKDGKDSAVARCRYNTSADKVISCEGWLVRLSAEVVPYRKKAVADVAIYENARELYGEARAREISAKDDAETGDVFAYESVIESNEVLSQPVWDFETELPVEYSGITVALPPGWQVQGHTFNHEAIVPLQRGASRTWELRGLPRVEDEPMSPPAHGYRAWLALDIRPPPGARTRRVAFGTWSDISTYFSPKFDAAAAPDAALKAKADALVAGAATPWERLQRLCCYAQDVTYISINLNAAGAGGMIPRPASRVLQCNYGDCKDKTTFLRALLRTQGIESYPLIVSAAQGRYIEAGWPSPMQFNHCILAIRLDPAPEVPARLVHPVYGPLVLFDPTDPTTPLGWLPEPDCGGRGLLLAGSAGDLIATPVLLPELNRTRQEISAQLRANGSLLGTVREEFEGQAASEARDEQRRNSASDFDKAVARVLGRTLPAVRLDHVEARDDFAADRFALSTDFAAPAYGKPLRDVLLVFKPAIVTRHADFVLKKEKRHAPVQIKASAFTDHTTIELPPEFAIDELPRPVELKSAFGSYRSRVEAVAGRKVIVERSLELTAVVVPADHYESVRTFLEKVLEAEKAPVVLRRQPAAPAP